MTRPLLLDLFCGALCVRCGSPIQRVNMGSHWGAVWIHADYTHYDHDAQRTASDE